MSKSKIVIFLSLGIGVAATAYLYTSGFFLEDEEPSGFIGVSYVGVSVSSLESAVEFHRSATDLRMVEANTWSDSAALNKVAGHEVSADTQMLESSNAQLRFMQFTNDTARPRMSGVPVNGPGIAHVCWQVDEKTRTYQRYLENGLRPIGSPEMVQINRFRPVEYAYGYDQDDMIVEVEHVNMDKVDLDDRPDYSYRIRHVSISTPNMDSIVGFYSKLLNTRKPRRVNNISSSKTELISGLKDSELSMAWFQVGNLELEFIQYHSHPTKLPASPRPVDATGYNMIVFDVENLAEARQKVLDAGGTIETDTEQTVNGVMLFARDTDGNLLGLLEAKSGSVMDSSRFDVIDLN